MPIPWIRLLDLAFGLNDIVRKARGNRPSSRDQRQAALQPSASRRLDARLAGAVVGALNEAFDRDHQRYELERERIAEERKRAERALRLELLRQAADREIGRLRLGAGVALAGWLGTVLLAPILLPSTFGRVTLGIGWLCLLAAVASSFVAQRRIGSALISPRDDLKPEMVTGGGAASAVVPASIIALVVIALGVLFS